MKQSEKYTLVIHGGVFTFKGILNDSMTPEKEKDYQLKLAESLQKGYDILKKGGSSLDAIEASIRIMEDSPLFNAGRGSAFTNEGKNEMDASIMDGKSLKAAAATGLQTIKNPITAVRAIMEKSQHVMMAGSGAEKFAKQCGIEMVDPSYFFDQVQWDLLQLIKDSEKYPGQEETKPIDPMKVKTDETKFGTVGAVALDMHGNLAVGTSTGGTTNKRFGRVGDSPIIGAGSYANNKTCAVSCTGHGEYFIRNVVAHDVSATMEYKELSLDAATAEVLKKVSAMNGEGGLIAVDTKGNVAMPFNTPGMYRGYVKEDGKINVFIYKE